MSSKGEKIVLSKGDIVDEGLLTDLLARIKTEFNRRAQSSSGESLKTYITNNLSSFSPNDDKGDKVAASDGNAILKAIAVLSVVNKASAST